ncbi:MAG: hypothetical protein LLH30_01270 [Candidatus Manganitrophus sp. SA1]|nr:hypothetical protein [Candidatus Manganitrophus morganii]
MSDPIERPEEGLFLLPGGYLDRDGTLHREVKLRPLTGREEEWIADPAREWTEAALVTALLRRCVERIGPERPTEETIRSLIVGDRDYLMLRLRQITFGKGVELTLICPRSECAKKMDIDLALDQIPIEPKPVAPRYAIFLSEEGGPPREVVFRIPNGADQEAARGWSHFNERERVNHLLARSLLKIGEVDAVTLDAVSRLSDETVEEITAAMERASPLVDAEMEARCPECGHLFTHRFEIVSFFLSELLRGRTQLEREVHLLGFYYHWPLREILGMTRRKRHRYLRLLTDELDRRGRPAVEVG